MLHSSAEMKKTLLVKIIEGIQNSERLKEKTVMQLLDLITPTSVTRNVEFFCIGNHMVLSAIWNKFWTSEFLTSEPVGRVLFELFQNSQVQIYSKIAREKPYDFQLIIHMKKISASNIWDRDAS